VAAAAIIATAAAAAAAAGSEEVLGTARSVLVVSVCTSRLEIGEIPRDRRGAFGGRPAAARAHAAARAPTTRAAPCATWSDRVQI
jgi:hypothetical protein